MFHQQRLAARESSQSFFFLLKNWDNRKISINFAEQKDNLG